MQTIPIEAVPLIRLAECLRDGTWVDLRVVDVGWLRRLQIKQLIVRAEGETIVCFQQWVEENKLRSMVRQFDSEDIMSIGPSTADVLDVESPMSGIGRHPEERDDKLLMQTIYETVAFTSTITKDELLDVSNSETRFCTFRHECLLLGYNMTNMGVRELCLGMGYMTQMPFVTAWQKSEIEAGIKMRVRKKAQVIDAKLGAKWRRDKYLVLAHKPIFI